MPGYARKALGRPSEGPHSRATECPPIACPWPLIASDCFRYALALRLGVTKAQLDSTVGIHPTCGEELTTMRVTRRSGENVAKKGC